MRASGIASHFLFRMAKEQSASARPRGARSLLLSLHPLRVCHFCVKVHSLLSKFEPCKSENRVSQPLAPLRGSQTVRHSPYEIKNERLFLDASILNQVFFYFAWFKAYSYSMIDFWLIQYVVVSIIFQPQYLYRLYELYCFTEIFWVENWSAV